MTNDGFYKFVTLRDAELRAGIRRAKDLGRFVMLKPHIDLLRNSRPDGLYWRGDVGCGHGADGSRPFSAADWASWFASYRNMSLKYAALAEQEGVEMLSINCELYCANRQSAHWRSIVAAVRQFFSGKLTEAAMPQVAPALPSRR